MFNWTNSPFENLFDLDFLYGYKLYVNYHDIENKLTEDNCHNLDGKILSHILFKKNNILDQLIELNKIYIVLSQFWSLYEFRDFIYNNIHMNIYPSKNIMKIYTEIKNNIIGDEPYNFIHYRYEIDFVTHFKIDIKSLDNFIKNIKFKNNNLKIYIATSNIKNLLDLNNCEYKNLIYKNDDILMNLNYEQRAFIDYMFGINSVECYGHKNSSFSCMINNMKKTANYYN